jgi:hypothetical protein
MNEGEQPAPRSVPEERWAGDLAFLREIPPYQRTRWRLAPPEMTYAAAHRWARALGAAAILALSSGETLVLVPEPAGPGRRA